MTPTASSSPILLLNPAAESAKPAATGTAETTADGALSGFELLFGAMTQLPAAGKLPAVGNDATAADDSGNTLPPAGLILPLAGLKSTEPATEEVQPPAKKSATDDTTQAEDVLLNVALPQ